MPRSIENSSCEREVSQCQGWQYELFFGCGSFGKRYGYQFKCSTDASCCVTNKYNSCHFSYINLTIAFRQCLEPNFCKTLQIAHFTGFWLVYGLMVLWRGFLFNIMLELQSFRKKMWPRCHINMLHSQWFSVSGNNLVLPHSEHDYKWERARCSCEEVCPGQNRPCNSLHPRDDEGGNFHTQWEWWLHTPK